MKNKQAFTLAEVLITLGIKRNTEGDSPKYLIDNKDKNNVILNFTKRTNELASCVSLYAQVRSSQKIQDLSSYRFRLGGRNDSDRKELINKPSPAFVVFAKAQTQLLPLTKREGNKKRKELINLSTYPLINFQKAFTLAEILITLGIIGIVAAMTIPALMTNYQKKVTATRVKKAYSELLQAIKLSEVENESIESWDRGSDTSTENTKRYVEKYIMPYYKGLSLCSIGNDSNTKDKCGHTVSFAGANYYTLNGTEMAFVVFPGDKILLYVVIDTNGKDKPNLLGTDSFYFTVTELDNEYKLRPDGWYNGITRETIKEGYDTGSGIYFCKKIKNEENPNEFHRHGCTALLMLDNWEFKNDYPW